MKTLNPIIVWFRQDLRLHDNPALHYAAKQKAPLIFVYIHHQENHPWEMGEASRWWLHQSLSSLEQNLKKQYGATLIYGLGEPFAWLSTLIQQTNASEIVWNRCYEPHAIERDKHLKQTLPSLGIKTNSFNASLLNEPWEYQNKSKQSYKVFTPFWRQLRQMIIRDILPAPTKISLCPVQTSATLTDLNLLPTHSWYKVLEPHWQVGETYAKKKLGTFLKQNIQGYKELRNHPSLPNTSKLSPHLHFGEISPVQIWHATRNSQERNGAFSADYEHFLSELAWREFSYHLLYYFPQLPDIPWKNKFEKFPWTKNKQHLLLWQKGLTGYPIVDAGMRELWQTGWMHNRVRMIVASFLIKHLLLPWQQGEKWFWDTLVDADLANNAASWQWVAGCGADAAPYFRIFNPVLQSEKFDPEGLYIKKWIPELHKLPIKYIHSPWEATPSILSQASVTLGKNYPYPIIDLQKGRDRALKAYQLL